MEVRLSPELEEELSRMASEQGRAVEALVAQAVEQLVRHDEWFRAEVEKGMQAAGRGEFVDDDEVRQMIDRLCPE